ncbi:uncharacterized protein BP5553_06048 [Venustampulla echinocandica]|uniref:Mid2 domain-containing protein n=1 Tax=Venustampulla echinocandica TaxID=2656787 RepID=A0A370TME6_9HELO|nr:uncharacterized protein BP5553_06048 [Venustampulla echinocandica]RDL36696.1 hypothetical protein BP5553_06048 [Venustampulla echinocandica]
MRIKILSLAALGLAGFVHGQKRNDGTTSTDLSQPPDANIDATIDPPSDITLGLMSSVRFTIRSSSIQMLSMLLCQSSDDIQDKSRRDIRALNTNDICVSTDDRGGKGPGTACPGASVLANAFTTVEFTITNRSMLVAPSDSVYYFFCLAPVGGACGSFSQPFNINQLSSFPLPQLRGVFPELPITPSYDKPLPFTLPTTTTMSFPPTTTQAFSSHIIGTTIGATVTAAPNSPAATGGVATGGQSSDGSSNNKGGLSVGAKVGIAVGAVAVVLILLILALLFLRRKHRQRGAPEQVMLNQSLNTDSRDLITEKEISAGSFDAPVAAFSNSSPTSHVRHPSLSPYETAPSRPYSGSAAAIPRRSPTTNVFSDAVTGASAAAVGVAAAPTTTVSREVSNASSAIISPRSTAASPTGNPHFEEYHDVPVYGDARHSPQVHAGASGSQQAQHLSESGDHSNYSTLSADEAARLREEEEERKIDAAIAEADRVKASGQHGRL